MGAFGGVGLTFDNVVLGPLGTAGCASDFLPTYVEFTMADPALAIDGAVAAIVYGGHIAAPGDALPSGAGSAVVPSGAGASTINGVFQAVFQATIGDGAGGSKTVNFKGGDIIPLAPAIDIEKSTNGFDADTTTGPFIAVGATVSWDYVVTNDGPNDLSEILVTDDQGVSVSCPATELAVGEWMTCTASGVAVAGQYENIGSVVAIDFHEAEASDWDPSHYFASHYFGVVGSLDIEKSTNGSDADTATGPFIAVGDDVDWVYEVTNNSNATVTGISVTDGTDAAGESVGDEDPSHYFGAAAAIDIRKGPDNAVSDKGGDLTAVLLGRSHTFWITVTNIGNVALSDVNVVDAVTPACDRTSIDIPALVSLVPGGSVTYSCDVDNIAAPILNVAVATGTVPSLTVGSESLTSNAVDAVTVTDSDPSTVIVVAPSATIGDTVWYDRFDVRQRGSGHR
jgi:uncharacterized repeat protein (TIGR01451 family)